MRMILLLKVQTDPWAYVSQTAKVKPGIGMLETEDAKNDSEIAK